MFFVVKNNKPMMRDGSVKMFNTLEDACKHPATPLCWRVYPAGRNVVATACDFFYDYYSDKFVTDTFVVYMCE